MITSGQIKAARAMLGLTVAEMAKLAGIGFTTMVRLESADGVPAGNVKTLTAVKSAIEKAGIEFLGNQAFTSWHKESSLRIGDQVEQFAAVDPYQLMVENFGEHVMGRTSWIMPMEQSLAVMQVVDQIKAFNSSEGKLE